MFKISWSGLADEKYYNYIAQYCLPSWEKLPGDKHIIHDNDAILHPFLNLIKERNILNKSANFLKIKSKTKSKTYNFWRKMQSQVWAFKNLKNCDFLVLLDTDIEVTGNFNIENFNTELTKFNETDFPWATGRSQSRLHDSGFIILKMNNEVTKKLIDHYENIWESGQIYKLAKSYDGHAVESMFEKYPSYKIMNTDYGKGFHVYDLGFVHYGSKLPKSLRINWHSDADSLIKDFTKDIKIKTYK